VNVKINGESRKIMIWIWKGIKEEEKQVVEIEEEKKKEESDVESDIESVYKADQAPINYWGAMFNFNYNFGYNY